MMRYRVALLVAKPMAESIFAREDLTELQTFADFNPVESLPETMTWEFMMEALSGAQGCITCWGTPSFTEEMLAGCSELKFIAHAAGSVRALVPLSFYESGRRITSNAPIIAEDVAQTTLALMLTSLKQLWGMSALTRSGGWSGGEKGQFTTRRLDGLTVGLVGASLVGRETAKLVKIFGSRILMYDPYLNGIEAKEMGVEQVELDDLIARSDVISLHAPANEDCSHMINAKNVKLIKDGALLINTARGMLIDEDALISELKTGRFMACIDVTDPEPPALDHPFRRLENVILTPHIAGGHTVNGRYMLGRNSIKEMYSYLVKGLIRYEVRAEMMEHMA